MEALDYTVAKCSMVVNFRESRGVRPGVLPAARARPGSTPDLAADLDLAAAEQAPGLDGGARRKVAIIEKFAVGVVHGIEIVEIGEMDFDLDDTIAAKIEFAQHRADGVEDRAGLRGDVSEYRDTGREIRRDQA